MNKKKERQIQKREKNQQNQLPVKPSEENIWKRKGLKILKCGYWEKIKGGQGTRQMGAVGDFLSCCFSVMIELTGRFHAIKQGKAWKGWWWEE